MKVTEDERLPHKITETYMFNSRLKVNKRQLLWKLLWLLNWINNILRQYFCFIWSRVIYTCIYFHKEKRIVNIGARAVPLWILYAFHPYVHPCIIYVYIFQVKTRSFHSQKEPGKCRFIPRILKKGCAVKRKGISRTEGFARTSPVESRIGFETRRGYAIRGKGGWTHNSSRRTTNAVGST